MVWIRRASQSAKFLAPLLALLLLWPILIRALNVNPQVFPDITAVARAGLESIRDGSLFAHIGASLARVGVGTAIAILVSVPLGVLMGVSPAVSGFLTPLLRFFSVLAGIAWIPIATLWLGYGFGAITFVIFTPCSSSLPTTPFSGSRQFQCSCAMPPPRSAPADGRC